MSWKTPWIARKCVILWPGVAVVVIVELRQDAIGMVVQLQVVFIIVYWELVLLIVIHIHVAWIVQMR